MNIMKLLAARYFLIAYSSILVFMLFPLVIVLFANVLASLSGCPEGPQYSNAVCTNGDLLNGLSQAGWLLVFTLPIGLLLLGVVIFLNILLYLLVKKRALVAGFVLNKLKKKIVK